MRIFQNFRTWSFWQTILARWCGQQLTDRSSSKYRIALVILLCLLPLVQKAESRQTAASSGTGVLGTNQDTVYGVYAEHVIMETPDWQPKESILVHNLSGKEVVLDSFSLRPDSSYSSDRLYFDFSIKYPTTQIGRSYRFLDFSNGQTNALSVPIRIPAHDSLLFGQFGIDEYGVIEKAGAAYTRYKAGDSIFTPLAFFSGKDSIKFQLRAKVMSGVLYHPASLNRPIKNPKSNSINIRFLLNGRVKNNDNPSKPTGYSRLTEPTFYLMKPSEPWNNN